MNRLVTIIVGLLLIILVGGIVYVQNNPGDKTQSQTATDQTEATSTVSNGPAINAASTSGGITFADVAKHNSRTSCWSTINGNIYDLTSWIPQHPGGEEAILRLCGTDGSVKFNKKHGGSTQQELVLSGFKIGVLQQ